MTLLSFFPESQVIGRVGVDEDIVLRAGDAGARRQLAGRGGAAAARAYCALCARQRQRQRQPRGGATLHWKLV